MLKKIILKDSIEFFIREDDLHKNFNYIQSLPSELVDCTIKFKDDLCISGLSFFFETINYFLDEEIDYSHFLELEGKEVLKSDLFELKFKAPFNIVLCAERLALNLLQKSSSITTNTKKYTSLADLRSITILDTRKTTPGLRFLEKYATQVGGAKNHRFNQTDVWMIKDNHKNFFGGVKEAVQFFKGVNSFYTPLVLEVHDLSELEVAIDLNIKHVMLDNFTPDQIKDAVQVKPRGMTYEVSGGVTLDNINSYLIDGVDAISSGSLTYNAKQVDISLKYHRAN